MAESVVQNLEWISLHNGSMNAIDLKRRSSGTRSGFGNPIKNWVCVHWGNGRAVMYMRSGRLYSYDTQPRAVKWATARITFWNGVDNFRIRGTRPLAPAELRRRTNTFRLRV